MSGPWAHWEGSVGAVGSLMVLRALGRTVGALREWQGTWEDSGGTGVMMAPWDNTLCAGVGHWRHGGETAAPLGQVGTLMGRDPPGIPSASSSVSPQARRGRGGRPDVFLLWRRRGQSLRDGVQEGGGRQEALWGTLGAVRGHAVTPVSPGVPRSSRHQTRSWRPIGAGRSGTRPELRSGAASG